jgi:hypothetical protein
MLILQEELKIKLILFKNLERNTKILGKFVCCDE